MSDWKSLAPAGGFSSADVVSLQYAFKWGPNSGNLLVAFLINNYPQARLILSFVTTDAKDLLALSKSTRYLDSIDVYIRPSPYIKDGFRRGG